MTKTCCLTVGAVLFVLGTLVLAGCGGSSAGAPPAGFVSPAAAVTPVLFNPWTSGTAIYERAEISCAAQYAYKIDPVASGTYTTDEGNTITIAAYQDGQGYATFDWTSAWPVCCVILKGSTRANVYGYGGAYSDGLLYAPINPSNGKPFAPGHVTVCFNEPEDVSYQPETAWAAGSRYNDQGNWATYVSYAGVEKTVDVFAGQTMLAGTATFSAPVAGQVTITINLANGFIFYQSDPLNPTENLKVQDYAVAPSGNPSPGLFDWKKVIDMGETSTTTTVPSNNFYDVHLDVAYPIL